MKSIYRKLGATTRTQAVTRSRELGLLDLYQPVSASRPAPGVKTGEEDGGRTKQQPR
jgi:hypothetical protein